MRLFELFALNHWLSIEYTLLSIYPDQKDSIDAYRDVYEKLLEMIPVENAMQIVLTHYLSDDVDGGSYVDVSGYKETNDPDSLTDSYAIEFTPWAQWLGMEISEATSRDFSELKIISHCLYEMTFCGYDEDEIQDKFSDIKDDIEEYKNMTPEEKQKNTKSLDDFLNEEE